MRGPFAIARVMIMNYLKFKVANFSSALIQRIATFYFWYAAIYNKNYFQPRFRAIADVCFKRRSTTPAVLCMSEKEIIILNFPPFGLVCHLKGKVAEKKGCETEALAIRIGDSACRYQDYFWIEWSVHLAMSAKRNEAKPPGKKTTTKKYCFIVQCKYLITWIFRDTLI